MPGQEERVSYNINAANIIVRYRELVEQTRKALFPWWKLGIVEAPNLQGMRKFPAFLAEILAPYLVVDQLLSSPPTWKKWLSYYLWIVVFIFWALLLIVILTILEQPSTADTEPNPVNIWGQIIAGILIFLPALLLYGYTVWFLVTNRNSWKTRLAWVILLLLLIIYFGLQIQSGASNDSETTLLINWPFFTPLVLLILIPAILFLNFNLLYFGKFFVELALTVFNSFITAHEPVSFRVLRELITVPIPSAGADWYVSELNREEIHTLKELAKNNLEATDKKTIPTIIIVAVIGFLATLPVFQQLLSSIFQAMVNSLLEMLLVFASPIAADLTIGRLLLGLTILMALLVFFIAYFVLFQNLLVQGIIVQACTIADYAKQQTLDEISQAKKEKTNRSNFLQWLIRFINDF
jgi:hypothetical protein